MSTTLQELQKKHDAQVQANRKRDVVDWTAKGNQRKADVVYEVVEGKHHMRATPASKEQGRDMQRGEIVWPGQRFVPTVQQVTQTEAGRGGLVGKVKLVEGASAQSVGRDSRKPMSTGADIGIRALPMAEGTIKLALAAGLTEDDFTEADYSAEGRITRATVLAKIEAKGGGQDN